MPPPGDFQTRVRDAKVWHLLIEENVNHPDLSIGSRITGQFTAQGFSHDLGSVLAEAGGFSRTNPLLQWVGGQIESLSFQARLFSEHANDQTARDKLEQLKLLRKPHQPLKRPPITRFFWGTAIPNGMSCYVESLGGIQYDEIRPDGSIRGLSLNITLKRFTDFQVERTAVEITERTPYHVVRESESYEMIAYRYYGDPLLGVPLRQQNPRFPMTLSAPKLLADLQVSESVKILPREDLTSQPIKPLSHIFDLDNQLAAENRRRFFTLRGRKSGIYPKR